MRDKIKCYQYNEKGEFIRKYESQSEVFEKYYDNKYGRLFRENEDIKDLPDGTYIARSRVGRQAIVKYHRIFNSKYCERENSLSRPLYVKNLKGDIIARFCNATIASLLTGVNYHTIYDSCQRGNANKNSELQFYWDE